MRFAFKIQYCVGDEELKDVKRFFSSNELSWNTLDETSLQKCVQDGGLYVASVAMTAILLRKKYDWLKIASFRNRESIFELSMSQANHEKFSRLVEQGKLQKKLNKKFGKSDRSSFRQVSIMLERDPGEPITLLKESKRGSPELDHDALARVLLHPNVGDRPVVLVSIAGAFRKGKSFILNFLLRYLRNRGYENPHWLGGEKVPADDGFAWKSGAVRHTTGITAWSEPFVVKRDEKEFAVILLDTQGNFDQTAGKEQCTKIFAISLLLSSVLIFNIHNQIQENDLDYLQFATEYGKAAKDGGSATSPFQKLLFLVRDGDFEEFDYGLVGGEKYLSEMVLRVDPGSSHQSLIDIRKHLRDSFGTVNCYLMPFPGEKVRNQRRYPNFRGCLEDIDPEFREHLGNLADAVLKPENLVEKQGMTAQRLMYFIVNCCNIIKKDKDGKLPKPVTMMQAHADAAASDCLLRSTNKYNEDMRKLFVDCKSYMALEEFEKKEETIRGVVEKFFCDNLNFGSEEFRVSQQKKLQSYLSNSKHKFAKRNKLIEYQEKGKVDELLCLLVIAYKEEISKAVLEVPCLVTDDTLEPAHKKCLKEARDGLATGIINRQDGEAAKILEDEILDAYELTKMRFLQKKETLKWSLQKAMCDSVKIYQQEMKDVLVNDDTEFTRMQASAKMKALTNFEENTPSNAPEQFVECSQDSLEELLTESKEWAAGDIPDTPGCSKASSISTLMGMKVSRTEDVFKEAEKVEESYWDENELNEKLSNKLNKVVESIQKIEQHINPTQATAHETNTFAEEIKHVAEAVFDVAKRRNKRMEQRVRTQLEGNVLEITLQYMERMETLLKGAYVMPDVLREYHKKLTLELLKNKPSLNLSNEASSQHEQRMKDELFKQYETVHEWNEGNKSTFLRVKKVASTALVMVSALVTWVFSPGETISDVKRELREGHREGVTKDFFGPKAEKLRANLAALKFKKNN